MIRLDPHTRSIRLSDGELELLLEAARSEGAGGHPDAVMALASGDWDVPLRAVLDPLVRVDLVVAGRAGRQQHRAWVTYDAATLLLAVTDGEQQLMHLPPAYLTAALVRLTRLRPRRSAEPGVLEMPAERLDDLVAPDEGVRRAALDAASADVGWRLHARWSGVGSGAGSGAGSGSESGGERLMHAVDGPRGIHLADPATGTLRGASNTFTYRALSTLLPTDAELAPA